MSLINSELTVAAQKSIDGKMFKVVNNKHVPYDSAAEVLSTITLTRRHIGQIFRVANGATIDWYEFVGGIADENLVKKESNAAPLTIKTKAEADALIAANGLIPGQHYKITGVDTDLYGGTDIILRAASVNLFEKKGSGFFYNPKYDQSKEDFGIWHNLNSWVTSSVTGTFKGNENFTANNGAKGQLFATIDGNKFIVTSGDFTGVTSITGDTSGATANVASIVLKTFTAGDTVIWGGKHWTNVNGNLGASTDDLNLNDEWVVVPYDTENYNYATDSIEYDYEHDLIISRSDKSGNVVVATYDDEVRWVRRAIGYLQWGNPYVRSTVKGVGNNLIINSFANCINHIGCFANNRAFSGSYFDNNKAYVGVIRDNSLTGECYISLNTILNSDVSNNEVHQGYNNGTFVPSAISSNILSGSYIYANDVKISSTIKANTLAGNSWIEKNTLQQISTINNNIFTTHTDICYNSLSQQSHIDNNTCDDHVTIWENTLYYFASIEQNTMSKYAQVYNNTLQDGSKIQINIIRNGINSSYPTTIYGCRLDNGFIRENTIENVGGIYNVITQRGHVADNLYGSLKGSCYIRYCTITGNGANSSFSANLEGAILNASNLYNLTINNQYRVRGLILTMTGTVDFQNIPLISNYVSQKMDENSATYNQKLTFDGTAGKGAIGTIALPYFFVPSGFFISEVLIKAAGLTGTGAIINLGIETDAAQAVLNDTTGDIAALNSAGVTKINPSTFTAATAARKLVMEAKTANITAGTLNFIVKLSKFI